MQCIELLVAEDNDADVYWLKMVLDECGVVYHMTVVEDGEKARDYIMRRGQYADAPEPDLILLDINLPRLTGLEVLREVADSYRRPICMVTSSSLERAFLQRQFGLKGHAYIIKPVDREKLLGCFKCYEHLKPIAEQISRCTGSRKAS